MQIPETLVNLLAGIGLFYSVYIISYSIKISIYYLKHKKFPLTMDEERNILQKKEIDRLSNTIDKLEEENQEVTKTILRHLS